jgi:nitroreductase
MEFREVVRRRRMVRTYDEARPIPEELVQRITDTALRAPSAGFSQGWGFLVLDTPEATARFREAVTPQEQPDNWLAANVRAPLIVVCHSNKSAYLDRYADVDKGHVDRSEDWWPAPYWDIDTGFAALLMLLTAVDEGLGACFFGLPVDRIESYHQAFAVPEKFHPIGAVSVGYSDEPAADLRARRKDKASVVHRGRWGEGAPG